MGLKARDRVCNRPAPHYGRQCNGSAREVQWCNEYPCPGLPAATLHSLKYFPKVDIDSIISLHTRHVACKGAVTYASVCLLHS